MTDNESGFFEDIDPLHPPNPYLERVCRQLSILPHSQQLAFAICCCDRLYPSYREFIASTGGEDILRPMIESMWGWLGGEAVPGHVDVDEMLKKCLAVDLGPDETAANYWEAAAALSAVYLTLEAFQGNTLTNVAKVSETARDRVWELLSFEYSASYGGEIYPDDSARISEEIVSDPRMISEENKQLELFRYLLECETLTPDTIGVIKGFARE